ncbi:glycosyltransferase family 39 protein [Bradyrhizobium sp. SRL28]|uniref:mannosyltransferase family protein n=1 Tax=Bradyrhizobium sp. SRL28 TaxID=2836178 RepID=UPI001BDF4E95|nr:mannosyltransferase family protein [Bradyrhizobium sp. SRL28]MBT1515792.1 glycosyltransferase family 39 protein [Bradyrhizobium sp. SRL28]
MQIFGLAEIYLNAGRPEVCRVMPAKCQSGIAGAIDLGLLRSDSMDMEMRYPIWKDPSWLPYCLAILIFFCSRVVVALGLVFSQKYLPTGPDVWSAGPIWYHQLLQWDSEWYFKIVTDGYQYNGDPTVQQNIVFYPLYPMLARGLATISGLTPADALLLVSNVAGLLAIVLLFKLVREEFGDQLALATTALLSFFPASVLLSAGYTEPLALLLIVSFFLALKRKYYLSAALLAGLAVATRSTGVVLLPVLLWEMWANRDRTKFFLALLPCVLLATSGIWLFMIYLWSAFGTPFAFAEGQTAFHQGTTLATRLIAALKLEPFTRMMLNDWNPWGQASWFTLLFIALIVLGWSRLRASWTLFAMAVLLLPYLTLSGGPAGFVSMSRFNLVSFPLFVTLAGLALRAKWLLAGVIGLFGASLFMNTALFARRIWIG